MRRFLGTALGILAFIVFLFSLGLYLLSDAVGGEPQQVEIRPGVWRTTW